MWSEGSRRQKLDDAQLQTHVPDKDEETPNNDIFGDWTVEVKAKSLLSGGYKGISAGVQAEWTILEITNKGFKLKLDAHSFSVGANIGKGTTAAVGVAGEASFALFQVVPQR